MLLCFNRGQTMKLTKSVIPFFVFQQVEQLKSENQKLKDENGALIRVISKLSKWYKQLFFNYIYLL